MREPDIREACDLVYGYFTSKLFGAEGSVQMSSSAKGRERKMRTLHWSVQMVVYFLESTCMARFSARLKGSMWLNCFTIIASYCCHIPNGKNISDRRCGPSVRRTGVWCLSLVEYIRQRRCMSAGTMANASQTTEKWKKLLNYVARSCSNTSMKVRRVTTRLCKEALREISLSEWPDYTESPILFQEDMYPTAYSILWFKPLHNLQLGILKLFKKYNFTYSGFAAIRIHPEKPVHEWRPFRSMRSSILRAVNVILANLERGLLFLGLWLAFLHGLSSIQLNRISLSGGSKD